jgi:NADH dehydrogenase FAD-containing subunit
MKKVVVIGGGFAGSTISKSLMDKSSVTLVDTQDFFEYTPSILRTIVEPDYYKKINSKHKSYLPKAEIIVGHVKSINENQITLMNGNKIDFDYLVIASGSSYAMPIKEQDTFFANRVKHLLEAYKKIQKSNKISIVGGGVVGVELASELCTHYKDKEITLIHSNSNLMERNNKKTSDYVKYFLEKHGVKLIFNEKILKKEINSYLIQEKI